MNLSKTKVFIISFILIGIFIIGYLSTLSYPGKLVLGGRVFNVDVVSNTYTLSKGLSGRAPISNNEGMFFVFDKLDRHAFWMKDMLFAIDIIWIDENFVINHIEKNVAPDTYPKIFYPNEPAMYVLEILAGETDSLGIKIGDKVNFLDKNQI